MDELIQKGRTSLLFLFGLVILIELVLIVYYVDKIGWNRIGVQSFRLAGYIILMLATFLGSRVGKWILSAVFIFSAVYGYFIISSDNMFAMAFAIVLQAGAVIFLQMNKPVSAFLGYQKSKYSK